MTPEELYEKLKITAGNMLGDFKDTDEAIENINKFKITLIQQAKEEWCKEQREFCADKMFSHYEEIKITDEMSPAQIINVFLENIEDAILNAPEPE